MTQINIKCPNCGEEIQFHNTEEYCECRHCHTKFINNKDITINTCPIEKLASVNVEKYQLEKEIKQCEILLMMIKNFDLSSLKQKSLEILEINPNNQLAHMIYHLDFEFYSWMNGDISTYTFQTSPLTTFFEKNKGSIDIETSLSFLTLLQNKNNFSKLDYACTKSLLNNIELLKNKEEIFTFYKNVLNLAKKDCPNLNQVKSINRKVPKGLTTFLLTNNEYISADVAQYKKEIKIAKSNLEKSKKHYLNSIIKSLNESPNLNNVEKRKLKLYAYIDKIIGTIIAISVFIIFFIWFI